MSLQGGWLPEREWQDCLKVRGIPDQASVVLALDGSFNNDSTALVAIEVDAVPHVVVAGLWERPPGASTWSVSMLEVEDTIRAACLRWHVVEIVCDPYRWKRTMEVLEEEGLPVVEFPQSAARMTPATQRVSDLVLNAGLTHDGDVRLSRHVSNAVLKIDSRGHRIHKENKNSARKIDLAVAMVMGLDRAAWHNAEAADYDLMDSFL